MKKIYLLFALLLSFMGVTQVVAQDDDAVVLEISKRNGNWTASGSPAYANEFATKEYSAEKATPGVRIQHWDRGGGHRNNMYFWDGVNLGIYSAFGSTISEDYRIYPSKGYYVYGISLDFIPGKHPNFAMNGVRVWANGEEDTAVTSPDAETPGHYEIEGLLEDEPYIPLTIAQLEEGGNPIFAHTYNFTVTLKVKDPMVVALDELFALIDAYRTYTIEGETAFVGDGKPGNYDAEAVATFNQIYNQCSEEGEDPQSLEHVQQLIALLEGAYNAVVESKVTSVPLADGYYRIRTGINYNDGEMKYIYVQPNSDATISGKWGSVADVETDCPSLWQVTNVGDGVIDIVSMAMDARFDDHPSTLSMQSENMMVLEPAATIDDVTYVNILYAGKESGSKNYIHQAGHASGAGTGGNLTVWVPSYPAATSNKMGGSEWVFEPVDENLALAIIAAYAPIKEREQLLNNFKKTYAEAKQDMADAKDIQEYTDLITDGNEQFSSPWTETREGIGKSGNWNELLDGKNDTYWHSDWSNSVPNHTHYLQVELNEPVYDLIQMKITRRSGAANDHITLWGVWGTNTPEVEDVLWTEDDELPEGVNVGDVKESAWVELASLPTPYGNNTETKLSDEFNPQGFKYLRFYIDGTTNGRGYGHVSEFQLVLPVPNPKSQYENMGEVAKNLDTILRDFKNLTDDEITPERYQTLAEAYEAFKALFVDPTELRELLASVEPIANGVLVGTAPGYWPNTAAGDALKQTYADAKAYDEAGVYVATTSSKFIQTLNEQVQAVKDAVIKVEPGKWYRIHFMSKETAEEHEWDIVNNEPVTVTTTSGDVVTNEALWDKYITIAKLEKEDVSVEIPPAEEGGNPTEKTITINHIMPYETDTDYDPADIRSGDNVYLDADADIVMKDLSMFRFVAVGDTAYAMQNKATGLFLNCNSGVKLSVIPSQISVSAVGYGQNVFSARSLQDVNLSNFNAQRNENRLVCYGETEAGSRSAFYIEEAGAVENDYDGTEFVEDITPGEIYSMCYPVSLSTTDEFGKIYIATKIEVSNDSVKMTLAPVEETLPAGHPFFYIYDEPSVYDPEGPQEFVTFKHGYDFVREPLSIGFMQGSFTQLNLGQGYIVTGGSLRDYLGQYASDELKRNEFYISSKFITNSVPAYNAYVAWNELLSDALAVSFELSEKPIDVSVAKVQQIQKQLGELYTIDGRLLGRGISFGDVKRFGKGLYILNGVKVVVK